MGIPHLTQLRLPRFKAFEGQVLPLASLTMLIGPNGSGTSNALDALTLLALLASDRTLTDLDRDDADVAGLRGGLRGCAPFGEGLIEVGATVDLGDGGEVRLDVALDPARSEVVRETLVLREEGKKPRRLVDAERTADSGLVTANVYTSGRAKHVTMPANRLVTFQATTRVPEDTQARRLVVETARQIVQVLAGIRVLDPIPSAMRTYARIGAPPSRTGATLSAQLYAMRSDPAAWQQLLDLVRGLIGNPSAELTFAEGRLPDSPGPVDVMVALDEAGPHGTFPIPASTMSDGTLRYLAILAALLTAQQHGEAGAETPRTVVIEEIENGLFPDQACQVLALLRRQAATRRVTLVTTTHSPALLDAVTADDHDHIVTVRKDDSARSLLVPLTEREDYVGLVQAGRLGHEVARGRLRVSRPVGELAS